MITDFIFAPRPTAATEKGPPVVRPTHWAGTTPDRPIGPGDVDPRRGDMPPENELLRPPVGVVRSLDNKAGTTSTPVTWPPPTPDSKGPPPDYTPGTTKSGPVPGN